MAVLDDVMFGFGAVRVARHAAALTQPGERLLAARDELVDVSLVTGVPDDGVVGGGEHAVQGDCELHDPEIRAEVTTGRRDTRDEEAPDLAHERAEFARAHLAETLR